MIKYSGMKSEGILKRPTQLPAGPYVAKVLDVTLIGKEPDEQLALWLDVAEGPFKDFFMNKYNAQLDNANNQYKPTYKGVYKLRVPNDANPNAMYPESDIRRMNDLIYRFEKSNDGFHWTGDEMKLKGLQVGINMQEDEYNGNTFTRIGRLEIADDVRKGIVKAMGPRKPREDSLDPTKTPTPVDGQSGMTVVKTEKLPWD